MLIKEFYAKFISTQESRPVFEAVRRLSRLEPRAFLQDGEGEEDEGIGWPEWPVMAPQGLRMQKA